MNMKLTSFIKLKFGTTQEFITLLKQISAITKILSISGEYSLIVEISAETSEDFVPIIESIEKFPGILAIQSQFVMKEWLK